MIYLFGMRNRREYRACGPPGQGEEMKEAFLYDKLDGLRVRCNLCAHFCVIKDGQRGRCGVRENREGTLFSLVYGRPIALNVDPIEKKPLFHFLPGSLSYSLATVGCNLTCLHCQNSDISQMPVDLGRIAGSRAQPGEIVRDALERGCASISYTYTEPTVFAEYVCDISEMARQEGIKNVLVTNGFMSPQAVAQLGPLIDGANVDLKAFSESFYKKICGARLRPVLESILGLREQGVFIELTTLLIPGANDSEKELTELAEWVASGPGLDTPWHISRFHPTYRLTDRGPTPASSLKTAFRIGREAGLKYIYLGNVPGQGGEDTLCPSCGAGLINRQGFTVLQNNLDNGTCPQCGLTVPGVFC